MLKKLLFLLCLTTTAFLLPAPQLHTLTGKQFISFTRNPSVTTDFLNMAVTSSGEAYSISPSTYNNPTKYTLLASDGTTTYPHTLKNARYMDEQNVFALVEASGTLKYQLFKATSLGGTTLRADPAAANFGELHADVSAYQSKYGIDTIQMEGSRNHLILVVNKGLQILKYDSGTGTIKSISGGNYHLSDADYQRGVLSLGDYKNLKYMAFIKGPKVSIPSQGANYLFLLDTDNSVYDSITNFVSKYSTSYPVFFDRHGFGYSTPKEDYPARYAYKEMMWASFDYNGEKFMYIKASFSGFSKTGKITSQIQSSENPIGIASFPGTYYAFLATIPSNVPEYTQGAAWSSAVTLHFAQALLSSVQLYSTNLQYLFKMTISSIFDPSQLVVSPDGEALFAGNWDSQPNIINFGNMFDLGCPSGQRAKKGSGEVRECVDPSTLRPNCIDVDPVSLSCRKCKADTGSVTYTLVDTPSALKPFYKSCRSSADSCDNSAGQYMLPDGSGCYSCSSSPNCAQCMDFTKTCLKCSGKYVLSDFNQNGFDLVCSSTEMTYSNCFYGIAPNDCKQCASGAFSQSASQCTPCTIPNCDKCLHDSNSCLECASGFKRKLVSGTWVCEQCPAGTIGAGEVCIGCLSIEPNPECIACGDTYNSCSACNTAFRINPLNNNMCEPGCVDRTKYLASGPPKACVDCNTVQVGGKANTQCTQCEDETGQCKECNSGFQFDQDNFCYQCPASQIWSVETKVCRPTCSNTEYWKGPSDNACGKCSEKVQNCEECPDDPDTCTKCQAGSTKSSDEKSCISASDDKLELSNKIFSKREKRIELVFNQKITAEDKNAFKVDYTEGTTTNQITVEGVEIDEKKLIIKITVPEEGFNNGTLTINQTKEGNIKSKSNANDIFLKFPAQVKEVSFYQNKAIQGSAKVYGSITSNLIKIQTVLLTMISFPLAVLLIQLFQVIEFIGYMNVKLPVNVLTFIEYFETNILTVVKNPIQFDEDISRCTVADIFAENDLSCLAFNSMGIFLIQGAVFLFIKMVLASLVYLVSKTVLEKGKKVDDLPKRLKERSIGQNILYGLNIGKLFFGLEFFSLFAMGCQLDALLAAFTSLKYGEYKSFQTSINYILAIIVVLVYTVYFGFLERLASKRAFELNKKVKKSKITQVFRANPLELGGLKSLEAKDQLSRGDENKEKNSKGEEKTQKEEKESKWDFFFEEVKQESPWYILVIPGVMLLELLTTPFIIYGVETPAWQVVPLLVGYIALLLSVSIMIPYKEKELNLVTIINSGFYCLILALLMILTTVPGQKIIEKDRYNYIGNIMIALIALAVLTNAVIGFLPLIQAIRDMIKGRKKGETGGIGAGKSPEVVAVDKLERGKDKGILSPKTNFVDNGLNSKKVEDQRAPNGSENSTKKDHLAGGSRGFPSENGELLSHKIQEKDIEDLSFRRKPLKRVKSSPNFELGLNGAGGIKVTKNQLNRKRAPRDPQGWDLNLDEAVDEPIEVNIDNNNPLTMNQDEEDKAVGIESIGPKAKNSIMKKFKTQGIKPSRMRAGPGRSNLGLGMKAKGKKINPLEDSGVQGGTDGWDLDLFD